MHPHVRRVALGLALLTTAGPAASDAHAESVPPDAAEATRDLFAAVGADDPGCTVAVARDGEIVFAEAFGAARLDPVEPMTVGTVVDIGSTSKQFTATAVLLLAGRGEIDLDAALVTYLPDLPSWASRPTVRQMMHHESGIPDYISLLVERGFELTGSSTATDALEALGDVSDLDFEPGASWQYSNSNYFLLAEVVRAVTGQDLGSFLGAEVFDPLGLDMVMDPVAQIDAKAVSYQRVNEEWEIADSSWEQVGDGAIQTTPTALVTWAAQYWEPTIGGPNINVERFEGAAEVEPNVTYGAGIMASEIRGLGLVLTHSGGWGGFLTLFAVAPELRLATVAACTSPDIVATLPLQGETDLLTIWAADDQGGEPIGEPTNHYGPFCFDCGVFGAGETSAPPRQAGDLSAQVLSGSASGMEVLGPVLADESAADADMRFLVGKHETVCLVDRTGRGEDVGKHTTRNASRAAAYVLRVSAIRQHSRTVIGERCR